MRYIHGRGHNFLLVAGTVYFEAAYVHEPIGLGANRNFCRTNTNISISGGAILHFKAFWRFLERLQIKHLCGLKERFYKCLYHQKIQN